MASKTVTAKSKGTAHTGEILTKIGRKTGALAIQVLDWPPIVWVLAGFGFFFLLYVIRPAFLNPYHQLQLFGNFPVMEPIGADLREFLTFSKALLEKGSPYINPNYYPPLESVFFLPLTFTTPDRAYTFITLVNYACFLGITFLFPLLLFKERRVTPILAFVTISGLFSYGFLFEIERGQYDLIVMAFCFAGLYLYHYHPRWRWLSYLLFSLSIQLKLYPGIFIFCFTRDWRDWKRNLLRWGGLLVFNLAMLFAVGPKVFLDFVNAIRTQMQTPSYVWLGNHSINSFTKIVVEKISAHGIDPHNPILGTYQTLMQIGLLGFYGLCLACVIWIVYRKRLSPLNPYLVLVLAVGGLVIPSTSHDYMLSIFAAPMAFFLGSLDWRRSGRLWIDALSTLLVLFISLAYTSILFMHNAMPLLINSNLPSLLLIAGAAAFLMWIRERLIKAPEQPEAETSASG